MKNRTGNKTSLYTAIRDEDLLKDAQNGDELSLAYLVDKYRKFVKLKSRKYFLIGADGEDVVQEGMLGLYKAILDYDHQRLASFKVFAELCITRQIITAIKSNNRQKHIPLNFYISLDKPAYKESQDLPLGDFISEGKRSDPEWLYIAKEEVKEIEVVVESILTEFEYKVLALYIEGKSYKDIAECLDRQSKSIDNALQRIRNKAQSYMKTKNRI